MDYSGLAKMAAQKKITAHPASMSGDPFFTAAFSSAYNFYGVPMSTGPAGKLTADQVLDRIFAEIGCPTVGYADYGENYSRGMEYIQKYAPLFGTCGSAIRDVAVFIPTTTAFSRAPDGLASLKATIDGANRLRDVADFDVIDERMALDGALEGHRVLIVFEMDDIEEAAVDAISKWIANGGILITPQLRAAVTTPEGQASTFNDLLRNPGPLGPQEPTVQALWAQCGRQQGKGGTYCISSPHNEAGAYVTSVRNILYAYPGLALADPDFVGSSRSAPTPAPNGSVTQPNTWMSCPCWLADASVCRDGVVRVTAMSKSPPTMALAVWFAVGRSPWASKALPR